MNNLRELPRKLGLFDATAVVVGTMIGSAIFLVPSSIARSLPSTGSILAVWVVAGVLSFFGALAYAELGAMKPSTGGQYVYLRDAFGPFWGFLCGWSFFLAARSGGIATVAVGFSIYVQYFVPIPPSVSWAVAPGLILFLTWVNYRGVRLGANVQNVFTTLKVLGILILIASAFMGEGHSIWQEIEPSRAFSLADFGGAMVAGLWAYNGWFAISLVAGEITEPQRNIPRALIIGVTAVMAIYLAANLGYLRVLSISEIIATERVAAATAERTLGAIGASLIALTIVISTIGTTNGNLLSAPRLYFAQARDGLFFSKFGEVHPRYETPAFSVLGQGAWAAVLALSGSYDKLLSYSTFTFWVFYGMTVAGVIVLRRTQPDLPRPYKMWGYPVTPAIFVAIAAWFVGNTIVAKPEPALMGTLMIASGVPVYWWWRRKGA
ncbi:MAG: amino acid permease [Bryobacteraceae bacterium]